jgi:phospholipase C
MLRRLVGGVVLVACAGLVAACQGGATIGSGSAPGPAGSARPGASPTATATATPLPGTVVSPGVTPTPAPTNAATSAANASPIKHIVLIIQENRTFDNLFNGFVDANGRAADTVSTWNDKVLGPVTLEKLPLSTVGDPGGGYVDFNQSYDGGKNDDFSDVVKRETPDFAQLINYGYAYVDPLEIQPYRDMATNGALAQRFFHGVKAPTWPSHLMFAAGSTTYNGDPTFRAVDNPSITTGWGCEDPDSTDTTGALSPSDTVTAGPYPCLSGVTTIADLLTQTGHTWRYYCGVIPAPGTSIEEENYTATTPGGNLNAFASYRQLYFGPLWNANVEMPETRVLVDAPTGTLADLTYVVPEAYNSDHSQGGQDTGPQWVASVVDAIGESPNWSSTAIFVTWDDYGGWFDHVPPPQLDRFGLSYRIPLIAISPYAKHMLIDTQYEPGSILKFIEQTFNLPSLGTTDVRANSVADMFDFTKPAKAFTPIVSDLPRSFFINHPIDMRPVDDDRRYKSP